MKKNRYIDIARKINENNNDTKKSIKIINKKGNEVVFDNFNGSFGYDLSNLAIPVALIGKYKCPTCEIKTVIVNVGGKVYRYGDDIEDVTEVELKLDNNKSNIESHNISNIESDVNMIAEDLPRAFNDLIDKVNFTLKKYNTDIYKDIFWETIRDYGKEGYFIEICHLNYTRSYLYINALVNKLPTHVYNEFRDKFKDKVLHVALIKYKNGTITESRKKKFKVPPYHIEFAISMILDELKSLHNLAKYYEGIRAEMSLTDRLKIAWEHKIESKEIIDYDEAFDEINDFKSILAYRRNIKDINNIFINLKTNSDFKDIIEVKFEAILKLLNKALKKRDEKIKSLSDNWKNINDKLIVIDESQITDEIYSEVLNKYDKNIYNPYTEQLIAYCTLY